MEKGLNRLAVAALVLAVVAVGCERIDTTADQRTAPDVKAAPLATLVEQLARVRAGETSEIDLGGQIATDEMLATIAEAGAVSHLSISESSVTARGLNALAAMISLRTLDLGSTELTDEGLSALANLPELRDLRAAQSRITSESATKLASMPALEHLVIGGPGIDDRFLEELSRSTRLRSLILVATPVTDEGLKSLAEMPALESVYLRDVTGVTPDGLRALEEAGQHVHVP